MSSFRTLFRPVPLMVILSLTSIRMEAQKPLTLHLDAAQTEIRFSLGATLRSVQGSFPLKGGVMSWSPETGVAQGEILIDAGSIRTNSNRQDNELKTQVLEVDRYPTLIFHPEHVKGTLGEGKGQHLSVSGMLTIHGKDHPLTLEIQAERQGTAVSATTHFEIPYVAWGLKDPGTFFFRTKKRIDVNVQTKGALEAAP